MAPAVRVVLFRLGLLAAHDYFQEAADGGRPPERCLGFYAGAYMLAAYLLVRGDPAIICVTTRAVIGSLLWMTAMALLVLSMTSRRFPAAAMAAARFAPAALQLILELLDD